MSGSEIIVILLLALVVLGPEKLPDAIRRAGRTYSELKKMGNSFQSEMRSVLDEPMKEMRDTADLLKKSVDFTDGEMTGSKPGTARPTSTPPPAVDRTAPTTAPPVVTDAALEPMDAGEPAPTSATVAAEDANGDHPDLPGPAPTPADELIDRTLSGNQ